MEQTPERVRAKMFTKEGFGVCDAERTVEWEARVVFNGEDARTRVWEFVSAATKARWKDLGEEMWGWVESWEKV
ncbi:hypothetical protein HK097_008812 [Rhizophlyctis rosea]|uniref:Uncharacterized protein n=1 Tax=Rhizophlyctis rosea TaxID=64517 RepID=A0AAD5SC30_9FUNG|nr:hypothetical protein HK097_008812 [Rhizophlyctis rosea]